MKLLIIVLSLILISSCNENKLPKEAKKIEFTKFSKQALYNGFIIGEPAVINVYLEISQKKDLLTKYKDKINNDYEGPCGEALFAVKVKSFGIEEIEVVNENDAFTIDKAYMVNDQVQIFDKDKKI